MKEIKAIIRQNRLDAVLDALHAHPALPGVTVSYVRGFGRTAGRSEGADATRVVYGTAEMVKLECVINDEMLDRVIDIIQSGARTGRVVAASAFKRCDKKGSSIFMTSSQHEPRRNPDASSSAE